jgi:hypothetical protein
VLVTDGLTEAYRLGPGAYRYRFTGLVAEKATQPARDVGEAILADWGRHPREGDYVDDVTVVVAAVKARPGG